MSEEIDRWVAYMKQNPTTWKQTHTAFINGQFSKQQAFIKRYKKLKGAQAVLDLYNIQNKRGYADFLAS